MPSGRDGGDSIAVAGFEGIEPHGGASRLGDEAEQGGW